MIYVLLYICSRSEGMVRFEKPSSVSVYVDKENSHPQENIPANNHKHDKTLKRRKSLGIIKLSTDNQKS